MFGTCYFYRRSCPLKFSCKWATWPNERMCAGGLCLVTLCKYVQTGACERGARFPNKTMTKDLCSRIHAPKRRMCARDGRLNRSLQHWEGHCPKRRKPAEGKMCNRKRAEGRLWPPESKGAELKESYFSPNLSKYYFYLFSPFLTVSF